MPLSTVNSRWEFFSFLLLITLYPSLILSFVLLPYISSSFPLFPCSHSHSCNYFLPLFYQLSLVFFSLHIFLFLFLLTTSSFHPLIFPFLVTLLLEISLFHHSYPVILHLFFLYLFSLTPFIFPLFHLYLLLFRFHIYL